MTRLAVEVLGLVAGMMVSSVASMAGDVNAALRAQDGLDARHRAST